MTHYKAYPFTAIVGQDLMKLALLLNAINPKIGGVLIKGTKGTAKSTAVRALADLLPEIEVIKDCPFNCNPKNLKESCHPCQDRIIAGDLKEEDTEFRKMRVINLPINATEDRVIGTIDIKKALEEGIKALEPGILAEANRNILYIDEVNLLADNVADVLLDSAAMGINIIEREGISLHHPSNFILVGTMNPEEGNLRPQLLDRFGLSIDVDRIEDIDMRVLITKYAEEYQNDPNEFYKKFIQKQKELNNKIINARKILPSVEISDNQLKKTSKICVKLQVDGHRADITINGTAKSIAAFHGRKFVEDDDIKTAAKLALSHRLRRLPFEDKTLDESELETLFDNEKNEVKKESNDTQQEEKQLEMEPNQIDNNLLNNIQNDNQTYNLREETFGIKENVIADQIIKNKKIREVMNTSGKRVLHPTYSPHGKYVGSEKKREINMPYSTDIAFNETLNEAALDEQNLSAFKKGNKLKIKGKHIHIKKRMGKSSYLIIFCVDASGSMGIKDRMETVKGAIYSILQTNYIHRDKVSLIVFRQDRAETILPPTRSTDLAYKLLKDIPTGGTTPLAAGLLKALDVAKEEIRKKSGYIPLIILLTDARGNVYFKDAIEDVLKIGKEIAQQEINLIVVDTEFSDVKLDFSKKLANVANAIYYHIDHLDRQNLDEVLTIEGILEKF